MRFEIKAVAVDDDGNREEVVLTSDSQDVSVSVNDAGMVEGEVSFDSYDDVLFSFDFKPVNPAFRAIKVSK